MPASAHPDRRLLVAVDMERYSRQDNLQQYQSQQTMREALAEAVAAAGLDRTAWVTQQGGDGELAILPAGTPEPVVVADLVPALDRALRQRNRSLIRPARVRLRMAVHQGLVHLDGANGFPGQAVVDVCRLCDARQLKVALAAFPDAAVALVVSDAVYRDVVVQGYAGLRPERYHRILVTHPDKAFTAPAWLQVFGEDLTGRPDLTAPDGDGPAPRRGQPDRSPEGPQASGGRTPDGDHPQPATAGDAPAGSGPTVHGDSYTVAHTTFREPVAFGPGAQAVGHIDLGGPA